MLWGVEHCLYWEYCSPTGYTFKAGIRPGCGMMTDDLAK